MSTRRERGSMLRFVTTASLARTPSEGLSLALVLLCVARGVSSAEAGVLVAATSFPQVLSGPLLGPRLDRAGDVWRGVRVAAVVTALAVGGLVAGVGHAPLAVALALAVLVAVAEPTFSGGISAAADRSIATEAGHAGNVHAWDSFSYNVAGLLAPAVVTLVAAAGGAGPATAALAVCVVAGAACSLGLRAHSPAAARDRTATPGVRPSARAMWQSRPLRAVTVSTTIAFVGFGGLTFASVAAARAAHHDANDVGQMFTVLAVGGLLGSWLMTRRRAPARPEVIVTVSLAGMGLILLAMAAAPRWWVVLAGAFVLGLVDGPLLVGLFAARVGGAPAAVRTTVFTLGASAKLGASALGAVIAAQLLDGRATGAGFAVAGGVHLLAAVLCAVLGVAR